jgi:hypothetical protein
LSLPMTDTAKQQLLAYAENQLKRSMLPSLKKFLARHGITAGGLELRTQGAETQIVLHDVNLAGSDAADEAPPEDA